MLIKKEIENFIKIDDDKARKTLSLPLRNLKFYNDLLEEMSFVLYDNEVCKLDFWYRYTLGGKTYTLSGNFYYDEIYILEKTN